MPAFSIADSSRITTATAKGPQSGAVSLSFAQNTGEIRELKWREGDSVQSRSQPWPVTQPVNVTKAIRERSLSRKACPSYTFAD